MEQKIQRQLERIEQLLLEQKLLKKEVLNFKEACQYLDVSESHLYKMTSGAEIAHFKPNGKKIYFKRVELDQWLQRNRQATNAEIQEQAANYLLQKSKSFIQTKTKQS